MDFVSVKIIQYSDGWFIGNIYGSARAGYPLDPAYKHNNENFFDKEIIKSHLAIISVLGADKFGPSDACDAWIIFSMIENSY